MFSVAVSDSSAELILSALRDFAGCANNGRINLPASELDDGSLRTSLAVAVNASEYQAFPETISKECPAFSTSAAALRHLVDHTGRMTSHLLDSLAGNKPATAAAESMAPPGFTDAVESAESLEHFHCYRHQVRHGTELSTTMSF